MSNTIVYEHNTLLTEHVSQIGQKNYLVRFREHVLSISQTSIWNNKDAPNDIQIINLETGEKNKWEISPNGNYAFDNEFNVFMYSDSLLWIGIENDSLEFNTVWVVNLELFSWESINTTVPLKKIIPVGQKYFMLSPTDESEPSGLYNWTDLIKLHNPIVPIKLIPPDKRLFPVDWTSSSIGKLAACVFCCTSVCTSMIEFWDENLELVLQLNPTDLFADYRPIPLDEDSEIEESLRDQYNTIDTIITVNDNCLLFYELKNLVDYRGKHIIKPGQTNIYCWDFTNNTQVKFPNYELEHFVSDVIPFRASSGKVKYFAKEWYPAGSWTRIYESV